MNISKLIYMFMGSIFALPLCVVANTYSFDSTDAMDYSPYFPTGVVVDTGSAGILHAQMLNEYKGYNLTYGHIASGVVTSRSQKGRVSEQTFFRNGESVVEEIIFQFDKGVVVSSITPKAYTGKVFSDGYVKSRRMALALSLLTATVSAYVDCKPEICPSGIRVFSVYDFNGKQKAVEDAVGDRIDSKFSRDIYIGERGGSEFGGTSQSAHCRLSFGSDFRIADFACKPHHLAEERRNYYRMFVGNSFVDSVIKNWDINSSLTFIEPDVYSEDLPRFKLSLPGPDRETIRKVMFRGEKELVFYANKVHSQSVNQMLFKAGKLNRN